MRQGLALLTCGLLALSDAVASNVVTPERERPLIHALYALGVQYRYGGASHEEGFDCSGLVTHVYERAWGVALPRIVEEQRRVGQPVRLKELQPGDLVFYNTRNRPFSHVGIYVGNGFFVHAPRPGAKVRMESVQTPYWRERFNGARRLDPPTF
jgi:cell wall-associated NlpC family hydrolase